MSDHPWRPVAPADWGCPHGLDNCWTCAHGPRLRLIYNDGWLVARRTSYRESDLYRSVVGRGLASCHGPRHTACDDTGCRAWQEGLEEHWWGPWPLEGRSPDQSPSHYEKALCDPPNDPLPAPWPPPYAGDKEQPPYRAFVGITPGSQLDHYLARLRRRTRLDAKVWVDRLEVWGRNGLVLYLGSDRGLPRSKIDGASALQELSEKRLGHGPVGVIRANAAVLRAIEDDDHDPSFSAILSAADESMRDEVWGPRGAEPGTGDRGRYVVRPGLDEDMHRDGFGFGAMALAGDQRDQLAEDDPVAVDDDEDIQTENASDDLADDDQPTFAQQQTAEWGSSADDPVDANVEGDALRDLKHCAPPGGVGVEWHDPTFDDLYTSDSTWSWPVFLDPHEGASQRSSVSLAGTLGAALDRLYARDPLGALVLSWRTWGIWRWLGHVNYGQPPGDGRKEHPERGMPRAGATELEVAEQLGVSRSTVTRLYRRAKHDEHLQADLWGLAYGLAPSIAPDRRPDPNTQDYPPAKLVGPRGAVPAALRSPKTPMRLEDYRESCGVAPVANWEGATTSAPGAVRDAKGAPTAPELLEDAEQWRARTWWQAQPNRHGPFRGRLSDATH